uniref:26S proteasome non-ATPase regulatory subunit 4 n=1 Tax=Plectus sambesii TaxID=2011161 RepID=A0A914X4F5_9BILA
MTQENNKLFMKLHQVQPKGSAKFISGIRVAHLALKHRQNRNHKMRIVMFVGSPMNDVDQAELVKQAKKLKKEKVHVDVVCFGEADSDNSEKLTTFIDTLNGKDGTGSHLVVVPSGSALTEALVSSPVCRGEDGGAAPVAVPGGGGAFDFGIDAGDDPELAMALRVSLEEQRHRQEQEARQAAEGAGDAGGQVQPMDAQPVGQAEDPGMMTEEQQLEWALRMSMQDAGAESMDIASTESEQATSSAQEDEDLGQLMSDPEMLRELVANLPGVDPDSQIIRDAVEQATNASQQKKNAGKKDDEGHGGQKKDDQGSSAS